MLFKLILALIAVLAVAWYFLRRQGPDDVVRPEPVKIPGTTSKFHAVSIEFEQDACSAAKEMAGRRFLASAPPKLPLAECNADKCRCHFKHHADRRSGSDRRNPFSPGGLSGTTGSYRQERRQGGDRRNTDDPGGPS